MSRVNKSVRCQVCKQSKPVFGNFVSVRGLHGYTSARVCLACEEAKRKRQSKPDELAQLRAERLAAELAEQEEMGRIEALLQIARLAAQA